MERLDVKACQRQGVAVEGNGRRFTDEMGRELVKRLKRFRIGEKRGKAGESEGKREARGSTGRWGLYDGK